MDTLLEGITQNGKKDIIDTRTQYSVKWRTRRPPHTRKILSILPTKVRKATNESQTNSITDTTIREGNTTIRERVIKDRHPRHSIPIRSGII
jgi:hypothetical protein